MNKNNLKNIVQYFYQSPSSELPVRDVKGEITRVKTEPHIEIGAENFLKSCYQKNIRNFVKRKGEYLFLITKCQNKNLEQFNKQFLVGYIKKEQELNIEDRVCIKGKTKLVSFEDSILINNIFEWQSFDRISLLHKPYVNEERTNKILDHFEGCENIIKRCIDEIKYLDLENKTCIGAKCSYKNECLRFKNQIFL